MNCQIDSHDGMHDKPRSSHNELRSLQYQAIGSALLISEAASHRAGIPWLPPSAAVRRRAAGYEPPLPDFIRYSLVTVSTNTLEAFCHDLETSPLSREEAENLYIPQPAPAERYALAVLGFGIVFAADLLLCQLIGLPFGIAGVSAAITGALGGAICATLCTEQNRRKSFHMLLTQELLRRSGDDQPNARRVPLVPVGGTESVSD